MTVSLDPGQHVRRQITDGASDFHEGWAGRVATAIAVHPRFAEEGPRHANIFSRLLFREHPDVVCVHLYL